MRAARFPTRLRSATGRAQPLGGGASCPPHLERGAYLSRGVRSVRPVRRRAPVPSARAAAGRRDLSQRRNPCAAGRSSVLPRAESNGPRSAAGRRDVHLPRAFVRSLSRRVSRQGQSAGFEPEALRPYQGLDDGSRTRCLRTLVRCSSGELHSTSDDRRFRCHARDARSRSRTRRRAPLARWFISCVRGRSPPRGCDLLLYAPLTSTAHPLPYGVHWRSRTSVSTASEWRSAVEPSGRPTLVTAEGIEPPSPGCDPGALPLDEAAVFGFGGGQRIRTAHAGL